MAQAAPDGGGSNVGLYAAIIVPVAIVLIVLALFLIPARRGSKGDRPG